MAQMKMCFNPRAGQSICSHGLLFSSSSHSNRCVVCGSIRWCSVVLGQVRYYVLLYPALGLRKNLCDCIYRLAFCVPNLYISGEAARCMSWMGQYGIS